MKPLLVKIRSQRVHDAERVHADDNLGRGMEMALTIAAFLGLGWALDRWLGTAPLFTIVLLVFAAVGSFIRMKYAYEATMERLEAERLSHRATGARRAEDVA